jgi:LPS-assembly protein
MPRTYPQAPDPCRVLLLALLVAARTAFAISETQPLHSSGDKQYWDRKKNTVELIGHAIVSQPGETITADYILLDQNARTLDARGNCVYVALDSVIHGDEMHFNMDTRTGSIVNGRVSNDQFTLSGARIHKLGEGRFQTHWGEYTTCRDCAASWSVLGQDVDMQMEGYAYMSNVTFQVKSTPAVWFPELIVPLKTKRQSGFLFPSFGGSALNGFMFVQPFFWAIDRSVDMTFGAGEYSSRGERVEWESRYKLRNGSGQSNLFLLRDKTFTDANGGLILPYRWAVNVDQQQNLPFDVIEKLKYTDASDNEYPVKVGDIRGSNEQFIPSSLSLSRPEPDVSTFVAFRRYRNLLNPDSDPVQSRVAFDPHTVQAYPSALVTTNDKFLFGSPVAAGLSVGLDNFARSAGPFDFDICAICTLGVGAVTPPLPRAGIDPLREATRLAAVPSLYTTIRPLDVITLVPSAKYYAYWYDFHEALSSTGPVPNLSRGYMLFQLQATTQIEKVYESDNPNTPRYKHLIRPEVTYSRIPQQLVREDPNHPFIQQIANQQGYYFDDADIVPIDSTPGNYQYFLPLGNSLQFGFTSQLLRRNGKIDSDSPSYTRMVELHAESGYNFLQAARADGQGQPLTRFNSYLLFDFGKYTSSTTYNYFPQNPGISPLGSVLTTSFTYIVDRGTHQRVLQYDRSFSLGYAISCLNPANAYRCDTNNITAGASWSLSDYLLPSANVSYDFIQHYVSSTGVNLALQSPSRCWRLNVGAGFNIVTGATWGIDLSLNLTGSSFGGVSELANTVVSH